MDYGVDTIKQQTWAAYGCLVIGQSPVCAGLSLWPGCTPVLTQQCRCGCSCCLWRYIGVVPLPFYLFVKNSLTSLLLDYLAAVMSGRQGMHALSRFMVMY